MPMNRTLFPSDIVATINRPLDGKANVASINERNMIPITHRYKGMVVVVQNISGDAQMYWLPSDDLSNNGWAEFNPMEGGGSADGGLDEFRESVLSAVGKKLDEFRENVGAQSGITVKLL